MTTTNKVRCICDEHVENGCRKTCPLAEPCAPVVGDDYQVWADRMNKAAEKLED